MDLVRVHLDYLIAVPVIDILYLANPSPLVSSVPISMLTLETPAIEIVLFDTLYAGQRSILHCSFAHSRAFAEFWKFGASITVVVVLPFTVVAHSIVSIILPDDPKKFKTGINGHFEPICRGSVIQLLSGEVFFDLTRFR